MIFSVTLLMPATSPSVRSSTSTRKPFLSQYLMYIRSSIEAQSCASVPPEPAWMSRKQLLGSSGLENMRRNSSVPTSCPSLSTSREMLESVASSPSSRARSKSSRASDSPLSTRPSVPTTASSDFFSLPSSCARCGLSHSFGSSSSRFSASRRPCFASKSKIPPQLGGSGLQIGERRGDLVDAFGFHEGPNYKVEPELAAGGARLPVEDLLLEAAARLFQRKRGYGVLQRQEDEGLLQSFLHRREIEGHFAVGPLHHEEKE